MCFAKIKLKLFFKEFGRECIYSFPGKYECIFFFKHANIFDFKFNTYECEYECICF